MVNLQKIQKIRKISLAAGIAIYFIFASVSTSVPSLSEYSHEFLEVLGVILLVLAICGRTWSTLYIGGRKKVSLVQEGPYSIMRNPLYTFTLVGAIGVGLQFGGVTLALVGFGIAWTVFTLVVRQEEVFLLHTYGEQYQEYLFRVPRFIPRFSEWKDEVVLEVQPKLVLKTMLDASLLLIALPAFELIEMLQDAGVIPVYFYLY